MKIYAEWKLYGKFYNDFFSSWAAFYSKTFNPECEIIRVVDLERRK